MLKINPTAVFRTEFDNSGILFNPESGAIFAYTGKEPETKVFYRFDGTVSPQVKPDASKFEFIGIAQFGRGVKGGKALEYAKSAR